MSILCHWRPTADTLTELSEAYFVVRVSANSNTFALTRSRISTGFVNLVGLRRNTSYHIDVFIGFPGSEVLWPIVRKVKSMAISTLARGKIFGQFNAVPKTFVVLLNW